MTQALVISKLAAVKKSQGGRVETTRIHDLRGAHTAEGIQQVEPGQAKMEWERRFLRSSRASLRRSRRPVVGSLVDASLGSHRASRSTGVALLRQRLLDRSQTHSRPSHTSVELGCVLQVQRALNFCMACNKGEVGKTVDSIGGSSVWWITMTRWRPASSLRLRNRR